MRIPAILACLVLLGAAGPTEAAAPPRRKAKPAAGAAAPADAPSLGGKSSSPQKVRFETHLRERLKKIADAHAARLAFVEREGELWSTFWGKVKEERNLFEVRMARQALALFDSLASLDVKDHATHIANYERLQNDVMRSFEDKQKAHMSEFYAERLAKLRAFAEQQERDRADFAAEAEVAWQENKAGLKTGKPAPAEKAPPPEEPVVEAASPEPARPVLEKPANPMKTHSRKTQTDDKWH